MLHQHKTRYERLALLRREERLPRISVPDAQLTHSELRFTDTGRLYSDSEDVGFIWEVAVRGYPFDFIEETSIPSVNRILVMVCIAY